MQFGPFVPLQRQLGSDAVDAPARTFPSGLQHLSSVEFLAVKCCKKVLLSHAAAPLPKCRRPTVSLDPDERSPRRI